MVNEEYAIVGSNWIALTPENFSKIIELLNPTIETVRAMIELEGGKVIRITSIDKDYPQWYARQEKGVEE